MKKEFNNREKEDIPKENILFNLIGLTKIPNLDLGRIALLHKKLNVNSMYDLYVACIEGRVSKLKNFTPIMERNIKIEIETMVLYLQGQCNRIDIEILKDKDNVKFVKDILKMINL